MSTESIRSVIIERITQALDPSYLEVIDDSAEHEGHSGAQQGAGHFSIIIKAEKLQPYTRLKKHQQIYALFQDLIPDTIHALAIRCLD